ncbi:MAG: Ig-like domain-containing protein [Candidatus Harrisonbacteria bacterium]|nr:Ig-like domain-containing protein [Candidatus Harrisonbacteria bacterium]
MKKVVIWGVFLGFVAGNLVFIGISEANFGFGNPPTWVSNQPTYFTVRSGDTLQFEVKAVDSNNKTITYGVDRLPFGATLEKSSGAFKWTPSTGQIGNHYMQFNATNGEGFTYITISISVIKASPDTSSTQVTITPSVTPVPNYNSAPFFVGFNPSTIGQVNQLYTFDVNASDVNNDFLTYLLLTSPNGMFINRTTGYIAWVPVTEQVGLNTVTVGVSDGKTTTSQSYQVQVSAAEILPPPPVVTITPPVSSPINERPAETKLIISNLKIESGENGEVIVSWTTNIPSRERVIWGKESQTDRANNIYNYQNATQESTSLATEHRVNIGAIDQEIIYYLRAVAKTDRQIAISREIAFVQLDEGRVVGNFGVANLFAFLGDLIASPLFLFLLVLALIIMVYLQKRKIKRLNSPL